LLELSDRKGSEEDEFCMFPVKWYLPEAVGDVDELSTWSSEDEVIATSPLGAIGSKVVVGGSFRVSDGVDGS
jgi:hypothetical protein